MKTPWVNIPLQNVSFPAHKPLQVRWGLHPSPCDPLIIGLTPDNKICRLEFGKGRKPAAIIAEWQKEWPKTVFVKDDSATAHMIKKIFTPSTKNAGDIKIAMNGTAFQQSVWKALMKIPMGTVITYAEIARMVKNPKAVRAAGTALGANPVCLLVPCHRVIGSDGGLGGFGGGLTLKRVMLEAENAMPLEKKRAA